MPITSHIIVGRDRAHVRALLDEYPCCEVITAATLFERVRALAFLSCKDISLDNYAPLIIAERLLSSIPGFSVREARDFSSLYTACYHGTVAPLEALQKIDRSQEKLFKIFSVVSDIADEMARLKLVNNVSALFIAWKHISSGRLPPKFTPSTIISLRHLVDLTMLEIEVIKALSRQGVQFDICFPLDFKKRGINAAVDFSASLFERDDDLTNIELSFDKIASCGPLAELTDHLLTECDAITLPSSSCSITRAPDLLSEADLLAARVATISQLFPDETIAVVVRSMDGRANIFKQSLMRYGLSVRDRKGVVLSQSPAGILLETMLSAKLWGLQHRNLIGLIIHPLFAARIGDAQQRSRMHLLFELLGIDDRLIREARMGERLRAPLERLKMSPSITDELRNDCAMLEEWLLQLEALLNSLAAENCLKEFLIMTRSLIDQALVGEDTSIASLKQALDALINSQAFGHGDPKISLGEFHAWLYAELGRLTVPRPDNPDLRAVEFLLLPELLGRQFDHVCIADISFGRLPKSIAVDRLLDDRDRLELNRIMRKPVLRIFLDDPFEPMPTPPRQALEPFWFATAIASARTSVHFSCAERDEAGQEQAPSEFFLWLAEHIVIDGEANGHAWSFTNKGEQRFSQGKAASTNPYGQALVERRDAFLTSKTAPFAFSLNQVDVEKAFSGRLGISPRRALSPTMVEAFADCGLRGWLQRIAQLKMRANDVDDIDARVVGEIAHLSLERYFADDRDCYDRVSVETNLRPILDEMVKEIANRHFLPNPNLFVCHQEWLMDALTSLIVQIENSRREKGGTTIAREIDFGLGSRNRPALAIHAHEQKYLLGGRVDRIDVVGQDFIIIDYKLSATDALKLKMSPKKLLQGNFQAPIYLRLVARHFANDDMKKVSFAFASIRDGELLPALAFFGNEEIFTKIFDDEVEGSLAREIDHIFSPIMRGEILAKTGEHCNKCEYSYVCRKTEWDDHEL